MVRDLRHRLYDRLQRLSLAYYDKTPSGAILSRVMDDVGAIQIFVTSQTFTILTDLGTTVAISALLLARDWRLAVVVLCIAPLFAVNFRYFMKQIRTTSTIIREKMDLIFGNLKAKLDGTIVIKAYAREPEEIADFAMQLDDAHVPRVRESKLGAAFSNISGAIGGVGTALVFAVGAYEVLRGRLTPGEVVSTSALAGMVFGPVARLADLAYVFEQTAASVDRLGEILDLEPDVREPSHAEIQALPELGGPGPGRGRVRPGGLWLPAAPAGRLGHPPESRARHEGRPGRAHRMRQEHSGQPPDAVLRPDLGRDPARRRADPGGSPHALLRQQIGVVLQDPVVFRLSLADNIRYGAPEPATSRSRRLPARPWCTTSPWPCPRAIRRWSARAGSSSARVSGSGWRSPGPCARPLPWWCSTRPPARSIPPARP